MLNRTAKLVAAVAVAMLALPAAAGSWPPTPPRKAPAKVAQFKVAEASASEQAINGFAKPREAGFEFVGGETGWQPTGHKFVWIGGRFEHSEDCDHAIRVVKAPTPAEIDSTKRFSPGA